MHTLPDIAQIVSAPVSIIALLIAYAQLRRTPGRRRPSETHVPTAIAIIGVPMDRGRDLPGRRRPAVPTGRDGLHPNRH